ncbi:pancreatic secretory granule membrane major glycoprotein GP2-like [Actinia tenebrosa]|uniref:Pancreatic secretory granule membrane major glycoprotein GP2-like n=1 Tax=Actinia tenebrosa TaxID=6105 RepID=A0A6P8HHM7_ACTTE|nr:pancreatic secretory granule membrane major glycoprotein GP2-like [Actinia tenebrosa]
MQLEARVNRTVNGAFNNSSPVTSLPLTVYVVKGIPSIIIIPVEDPDGDIVRCRYASYQECYRGMCTYFPHGVLDEGNCILSYNGGGYLNQLFPIILKLEDFPSGTTQFDSSNSLGSVDLQFVVHLVNSTECRYYSVLNSRDRAQGLHRGNTLKCDNTLVKGWYRFMGDAGTAMPTSCTRENYCGTHASGWMQGSHPTQAEGIVNRAVCYHWSSRCCNWNNNIRVRNCGGFYVYELVKPTAGCYLRYCGSGNSKYSFFYSGYLW